jgi:Na+-translocating ferredoxin:NAD+ oxidoreductase RnfC subunit
MSQHLRLVCPADRAPKAYIQKRKEGRKRRREKERKEERKEERKGDKETRRHRKDSSLTFS